MDAKTVAIVVLVVTAMLLGGIAASGLRPEPAYGQGGVYATYLAASASIREDYSQFIVADTANRRLIFYEFNVANKTFAPADGVELVRDFNRKAPY
jgi:hypothetical protein